MSNVITDISIDLKTVLDTIETINKKSETNKGIYLKKDDVLKLSEAEKIIHILLYIKVSKIENIFTEHIKNEAFIQGKYSQIISVLKLCYEDYSRHGRIDAMSAIQNSMSAIQ